MAYRTVRDLAKTLQISPNYITNILEKKGESPALDDMLSDDEQNDLLLFFLLNQKPQLKNFKESSEMPNNLLETKSKLDLLYQYEKHYLELIKDYKEEIKFASSLQEDLRRERSQFFTQTLREVVQTLQAQEIDKKVASQWIEELVASYTKSIDLSSDLAKTHVVQVLSIFKEEAKQEVSKAKLDNLGANSSKVVDAE